jgi:hypothetical protein
MNPHPDLTTHHFIWGCNISAIQSMYEFQLQKISNLNFPIGSSCLFLPHAYVSNILPYLFCVLFFETLL